MNNVKDYTFTKHATERILDMALDPREVQLALQSPDEVKQCTKYPACDLYDHGRITLSVDRSMKQVVTVLWRTQRGWAKDINGRGGYGSRKEVRRLARTR